MNSITRTVNGIQRRAEIDYWRNKGFVLINEHTRSFISGEDDIVTLVFDEKLTTHKEGRRGDEYKNL